MVYTFVLSHGGSPHWLLPMMVAIGLSVIALALFSKKKNENTRGIKINFYVMIVVGIAVIILGVFLSYNISKPAYILVGNGWVSTKISSLTGAGNVNVTTSQIDNAYVYDIKGGNITLSIRDDGTSIGEFNTGLFTLSNGAKADVATSNYTAIIMKLSGGKYLILGSNDTLRLASIISSNVYNVSV